MRTILCLQYFRAADPARQAEIDHCLAHNLRHPALDAAVIWLEPGAPAPPAGSVPVEIRPLGRRLRFADWLRLAAESGEAVVVLANADITLEAGFERLERLLPDPTLALALSRFEAPEGEGEPRLAANAHWRQDCWAIRGDAPIDPELTAAAELPLGRPGSDNRIAHVLWSHGLRLSNPALHLRTLHHQRHRSADYDRCPTRLFGACTHVHPCLAPGEVSELEHRIWSRQPERSGGLSVQVEPRDGEAGLQPFLAAASLEPGWAGPATPFQDRRSLAALAERSRPLGSHDLAVGGATPPACADTLFLPLSALAGNGVRLHLPLPQRLAGIAVRLPLSCCVGGRLRLEIFEADEAGGERVLELPLSPGRGGGPLLLPPPAPAGPITRLTLALRESDPAASDHEAFLELRLLAELGASKEPPERLMRWGERFELRWEAGGLVARDRFWPGSRPLAGLCGDAPSDWFAQAFVPPLLEWKPGWIPARPAHPDARLHWQGAGIEAAARRRHARRMANRPGVEEAGGALHTYVGLPWSVWLRAGSPPERLLAAYATRIRAVAAVLAAAGRSLRVHTVCESPHWGELVPCWRELGISDLWLCHPPRSARQGAGFRLQAWPALAEPLAVEDSGEKGDRPHDGDWDSRPLLAGFRGDEAEALPLAGLAEAPDLRIERGATDDPSGAALERQLLARCRFALCPAGPGSDPGRLWRALAAGAVPVLLGEPAWLPATDWLLPPPAIPWPEAALLWQPAEAGSLLARLRAVEPLEWRAYQLLGARLRRAAERRTCFDGPPSEAPLRERGG